ncbi:MAG: hypothetical protein WKF37_25175, partial [Bryobacteraceae bacterium]
EQIRAASDKLTAASHKLAEAMYRSSGPETGAPPMDGAAGAEEPKKDDVVDAEFVDVDEKAEKK